MQAPYEITWEELCWILSESWAPCPAPLWQPDPTDDLMIAAITQVRKQLTYRPFRPFWLETIGGTRIYVQRSEWFHEMPDGPLIISEGGIVTLTWWGDLTETIEVEGPPTK